MANGKSIVICGCGEKISWPKTKGGRIIKCPHCGRVHHFKNNKYGRRKTHTIIDNLQETPEKRE